MASIEETLRLISRAATWDQRVQAIRRIPELHGQQEAQAVYAAVAEALYRPHLSPQFAYVHRAAGYEREPFESAYRRAFELTSGFHEVSPERVAAAIEKAPETLLVFRTIVGYTPSEFAAAIAEVAGDLGVRAVSAHRVRALETGARATPHVAALCAETIHHLVTGALWGQAPEGLRSKLDKFDTELGWETVRGLAASGVPYEAFLLQRHVGGAFRQLLDATSELRGELLETPVESLLSEAGVSFVRTGAANQGEIAERFNLTVRPAPDFVVFEPPALLRAMIECKQANDGGTARDKAARYRSLRQEATRLGGVALFAVLDGLGWQRVNDALGPVVRDTDGRVFTLATLAEMLTVEPFPPLARPPSSP
jgi:hypothetical protein